MQWFPQRDERCDRNHKYHFKVRLVPYISAIMTSLACWVSDACIRPRIYNNAAVTNVVSNRYFYACFCALTLHIYFFGAFHRAVMLHRVANGFKLFGIGAFMVSLASHLGNFNYLDSTYYHVIIIVNFIKKIIKNFLFIF